MEDFLKWLTGPEGGALILVMWALSWGFEGTAWWDGMLPKAKKLIFLGLALVLGLAAIFLQTRPDIVALVDPYFRVVSSICILWISGEGVHKIDKLVEKEV